jgi:hypothetical protein
MPNTTISPFLIVFEILIAGGSYLWCIFLLPKLICKDAEWLSPTSFRQRYPHTRWILIAHEIMAWLVVFGSLIGGMVITDILFRSVYGAMALGFLMLLFWNGIFELLTAISPKYGFIINKWNKQTVTYGLHVRWLGLARIGIVMLCLMVLVALHTFVLRQIS